LDALLEHPREAHATMSLQQLWVLRALDDERRRAMLPIDPRKLGQVAGPVVERLRLAATRAPAFVVNRLGLPLIVAMSFLLTYRPSPGGGVLYGLAIFVGCELVRRVFEASNRREARRLAHETRQIEQAGQQAYDLRAQLASQPSASSDHAVTQEAPHVSRVRVAVEAPSKDLNPGAESRPAAEASVADRDAAIGQEAGSKR